MENGIKGSRIGYNLFKRGGYAPGMYWPASPPPLTPVLHRVAAKLRFCNFAKFRVSQNFPRILQKSKLFCQNFVFREILTK